LKGKTLGRMHDEPSTTNIAFGGGDWKTLYFTTRSTLGSVGSVKLKTAGMPVPVRTGSPKAHRNPSVRAIDGRAGLDGTLAHLERRMLGAAAEGWRIPQRVVLEASGNKHRERT
jgi:hypothetical protein